MASAFQCDLCAYCEPGEPMVRFKVEAVETTHRRSEEWCDDCMASYEKWRCSRKPLDEVVEA